MSEQDKSLATELVSIIKILAVFLGILWTIELIDEYFLFQTLNMFGIRPRTPFGLVGILTWTLLHANLAHLISNTFALLTFGAMVLMYGRREFWGVLASSWLIGGAGVWIFGRAGDVHIGASGVVFGLFGYLLARGFYERKFVSVIVSVVIAVLFGTTISGAIPGIASEGVSWEGHLFGLLGGVLVARRFKTKREKAKTKPELSEGAKTKRG